MAGRRLNPRLVKIHYSYTPGELASLLGVHKNTITHWRRQGLKSIDSGRPVLFNGKAVRLFLERRRQGAKQPCGQGELYCLRCRKPRRPAGDKTELIRLPFGGGNLRGGCPDCQGLMYRRIPDAQVNAFS
jgi:Helix-turn-helix domain